VGGHMTLWLRSLALIGVGLALAGCPDPQGGQEARGNAQRTPSVPSPFNCFPEASRRWIAASEVASSGQDQSQHSGATIFVDGSGSMAGFLRGGRPGERPFESLLSDAPGSIGHVRGQISYQRFGAEPHPVEGADIDALVRPSTYACRDCDNQESRLDLVFQAISELPADHLAIVLTDLWMTTADLAGSAALNAPIQSMLASGRAISIYGFDAPYQGEVYDLPSGRRGINATRRPLYLIAIGRPAQLEALQESLVDSSSPYIHDAFANGDVRRALFSTEPEAATAANARPFNLRGAPALHNQVVLEAGPRTRGLTMQQLRLSRSTARRSPAGQGGRTAAPSWTGPTSDALLDGAVWQGPLEGRTRIWRLTREGSTCRPDDWEELRSSTSGWLDAGGRFDRTYELDVRAMASQLNPGTYLVVGEVLRTDLDRPNPATDWMREWSFSPANEADMLASSPALFPTLNLAETARLLENALRQVDDDATPVSGFSVIIKVTN
jgi:hypothetical protein